ncbi:hypothetical protein HPB51_018291 [Rhipicephalus microplus]|uniref:Cuticle protein 10.9 n=1 Tax=Rhipicephalus microplus TaxID=6941 RepID=A0A9J6D5Y0_RHIMP|nr:hypothetical protein HPB51_018291 [Rhipicephalus microplus]
MPIKTPHIAHRLPHLPLTSGRSDTRSPFDDAWQVAFLGLLAIAAAQVQLQENYPAQPYTFSYDSTGEDGGRISQQETGDERNFKTAATATRPQTVVYRTANYVADDQGFRVSIDTNEPGTKAENPADVTLNANPN